MTGAGRSRESAAGRPGPLWFVLRAQWAAGLVSLSLLAPVSRPALLLAVASFLAGTAMDAAGSRRRGLRWLPLPAAVLAGAAGAGDLLAGSRDFLAAASVLVLIVQSVMFLLPKRPRDGWQLCGISMVEFLAAAASTSELSFAAFLFLFLGLSAGAMWALHEAEEDGSGDGIPPAGDPRFAAAVLGGCAAGGFLLTVLLFAAIPRLGLGRLARAAEPDGMAVGFSDSITLSGVTAGKSNRAVVARVEFSSLPDGIDPLALYLRGTAFERFTGSRWIRRGVLPERVPRIAGTYRFLPVPWDAGRGEADITLEPSETPVLFLYGTPVEAEGDLGPIQGDPRSGYRLAQPPEQAIRYLLRFSASPPPGGPFESPGRELLAIPPGWDRVRELAGRITADARSDQEKADRILAHLRSGYRYTLERPARSVREFLFDRKQGYCEHFATALALLLRGAGVPARVAAGYLGGEWNEVGNYLIVRQSDAHAWTEARIGGRWILLDATPAADPFHERTGLAGMYLDWARQQWRKYVVNYSLRIQAEALGGGIRSLGRAWRTAAGGGRVPRVALWIALAAATAAALLAARRHRGTGSGGPRRAGGSPPVSPPLPRAYGRLFASLERRGFRDCPGTSPAQMLRAATAGRPDLSPLADRFLSLYFRERFGARGLPPDEGREAARLARELLRAGARPGAR